MGVPEQPAMSGAVRQHSVTEAAGAAGQTAWFTWFGCLWELVCLGMFAVANSILWRSAVYAVAASVFLAGSVLLSPAVDTRRLQRLRDGVVWVELAAAGVACLAAATDGDMASLAPLALLPVTMRLAAARVSAPSVFAWTLCVIAVLGCLLLNARVAMHAGQAWWRTTDALPILILLFAALWWRDRTRVRRLHEQRAQDAARFVAQQRMLERSREQISAYAEQVYTLAAAEERNRIAGEIHDTVAHRLSALIVQLQVARRLTASAEGHDQGAAQEALRTCEDLARDALDDARRAVRAMRTHSGDASVQALRRLALEYGRLAGMEVNVRTEVDRLPTHLMGPLQRALQEALTNAHRHGRATRVKIDLWREGPQVRMRVVDNGRGASHPRFGVGLATMAERAQEAGGELRIRTEPGRGFELDIRLPVWGEIHDPRADCR